MATKKIGILCFFLLAALGSAIAQAPASDPFHDADGNTWHRVYLDFRAISITEINYTGDPTNIDAELSTDGFSVIIKNYPGDKSVRMKVVDETGIEKEITKGRCFIDPILIQL
jgi:hypothetical protein